MQDAAAYIIASEKYCVLQLFGRKVATVSCNATRSVIGFSIKLINNSGLKRLLTAVAAAIIVGYGLWWIVHPTNWIAFQIPYFAGFFTFWALLLRFWEW